MTIITLQNANINTPLDSFGNVQTSSPDPQVSLTFQTGLINTQDLVDSYTNGSGAITNSVPFANITSGTTANSYANMKSQRLVKYNPGLGIAMRFTTIWNTGISGTTQIVGFGTASNGYFFGYNGTDFGVLRRTGGLPEIRTLTVTTAATGTGNTTVTLGGIAYLVAVTSAGATVQSTAREIASGNFTRTTPSGLNEGWTASYQGAVVTFIARTSGSRSGTYGVALQGVAGTFASVQSGLTATNTWVAQSAWNTNKFNSGSFILDPTKGNVYQITFQWLGFGQITFWVENPNTGNFEVAHYIRYANTSISTSINNATCPAYAYVDNGSTTSIITIKIPSIGIFVYNGGKTGTLLLPTNTAVNSGTASLNTTYQNLLSIRNKVVVNSIENFASLLLSVISLSFISSAGRIARFRISLNPIFGGNVTWASMGIYSSVDFTTSLVNITNSGRELFNIYLSTNNSQVLNIINNNIIIQPGTIVCISVSTSANDATATIGASLSWIED